VDAIARDAGFATPVMWTGSYGDSTVVTPQFLLDQARRYLTAGRIVLGHANHPTVLGLFDQISSIIRDRGLQPVTLDEFFGTRRH
jgi:peptidoglycan/xylan/chitin deacetylase (PgdA/CDA1 family)